MKKQTGERRASTGPSARPATFARMDRFALEELEHRRLLSVSLMTVGVSDDGVLTIRGTEGPNFIIAYRSPSDPNKLAVSSGSDCRQLDLTGIRGIRIEGLGGDDNIFVLNRPDSLWVNDNHWDAANMTEYGKLNIPVTMLGGAGDDNFMSESNADDVYIGGTGEDRAMIVDGHDLFGTEYAETFRDEVPVYDDHGRLQYWFSGTFQWGGAEDELYADPWLVPNRNGTYGALNAPTFPDETPEPQPKPIDDADPVVPPVVPDDSGAGEDVAKPTAPVARAVVIPPATFGVTPVAASDPGHHHPWDDGESTLL